MDERKPGWSAAGGVVMAVSAGGASAVLLTTSQNGIELALAAFLFLLALVGLYWMIAALRGWPPFTTWTPAGERRPHGPIGAQGVPWFSTSASPSASPDGGYANPSRVAKVKKATFGRADQNKWANVTKAVRGYLVEGQVNMTASVPVLGKDPAFGFIKELRVKYRVKGGGTHRVVFNEGEQVVLP